MHIISCDFDLFPPTLADGSPPSALDLERMDTEATTSGSSAGVRAAGAGVVGEGAPRAVPPDPLGLDNHEDSFDKVKFLYFTIRILNIEAFPTIQRHFYLLLSLSLSLASLEPRTTELK